MAEDTAIVANDHGFLYKLSAKAVSRLLDIPTRAIARVRRLDNLLDADNTARTSGRFLRSHAGHRGDEPLVGLSMDPIPGPLGFLTSGYFFGLFVMVRIFTSSSEIY